MTALVWIIPFVLLIFWAWMFWDMANKDKLSACYIAFTDNNKLNWTIAFIVLSILTAGYYFFTDYKTNN